MTPKDYVRRGFTVPADELQHTSTAWHYGGAWIVWFPKPDGSKQVLTQSLDPARGLTWIDQLRKLQQS